MSFKHLRRNAREGVLSAFGLPSRAQVRAYHKEEMYFKSFLELKSHLGIDMPFFPFGGAANSSLLYLLTRAVSSLNLASICELGSGQSTLLLDSLATIYPRLQVDSFEQRKFWACEVSSKVQNSDRVRVLHRELREQNVRGVNKRFYDLPAGLKGKTFDLILIDGPSGEKRNSRWGSLQLIDQHLSEDFLIIFDDAERRGEQDTYTEALKLLTEKGIQFGTETVEAKKSQFIIASEKMRCACYF